VLEVVVSALLKVLNPATSMILLKLKQRSVLRTLELLSVATFVVHSRGR
jgi:hypothetical protein